MGSCLNRRVASSRLVFLLSLLCVSLGVLLLHCEVSSHRWWMASSVGESPTHKELARLRQQVLQLRKQLAHPGTTGHDCMERLRTFETHFMRIQKEAELTAGKKYQNEFEQISFSHFTANKLSKANTPNGKNPVANMFGSTKTDLMGVVEFAASELNKNVPKGKIRFSAKNFVEGYFRSVPTYGNQYELYFKEPGVYNTYRKVTTLRPYGPLNLILSETQPVKTKLINLIVPLSGKIQTFGNFMKRFIHVCIVEDKHVFLTVVYFGQKGFGAVKRTLEAVSKKHSFSQWKIIPLNETFSRGRGLQVGAEKWSEGDVLMFFCDVDIAFKPEVLERCRLNAKKGKRVYYPIVFSLYNPSIIYGEQGQAIPPEDAQLKITKFTGFWRDFGYGMACLYRSDFFNIGGFDKQVVGWGKEDVLLYRKYIKSNMMIIRAVDPGIFHLWHEKVCDKKLSKEQLRSCLATKAITEASQYHLGILAFKDEIDAYLKNMNNRTTSPP